MNKAVIVAGMAYGDEAKGATVDFLCRDLGAGLVVRYNGGHQAAHNVVTDPGPVFGGMHHTFSQFGSGSFVPGVRTHLSRFMMINPIAMMEEEEHLRCLGVSDMWERTTVHNQCLVVTPYHRAFNRLQEMSRGHRAHGSCGMGIGTARRLETYGIAVKANELLDSHPYRIHLRTKLLDIKLRLASELLEFRYLLEDTAEVDAELTWLCGGDSSVNDRLSLLDHYYDEWTNKVTFAHKLDLDDKPVIFEGAQGVLLDEKYGVAPHNTWTNTTFENAQALLDEAKFTGERIKLGCWRSYFTRHGNGPFLTEEEWSPLKRPEHHNTEGRYQGKWRVGLFDFDLAHRAVEICGGIDQASVSHMDVVELNTTHLEHRIGAPVTLTAYGPTARMRYAKTARAQVQDPSAEPRGSLTGSH